MKRPNIVLFLAEDLDFEGLNCCNQNATGYTGLIREGNSYAKRNERPTGRLLTPTIDSLAADGQMFTNYYCTSPICTPARYTVMTGRLPERSREHTETFGEGQSTVWFNSPVCPGDTLLPKALKAGGYRTALFGKWHNYPKAVREELDRLYFELPGDASWDDPAIRERIAGAYRHAADYLMGNDFGWDFADRIYHENPEPYLPAELSSHNIDWVIEGADAYIRAQAGRDEPFFAYIAVSIPHSRYSAARFREANPLSSPAGLLERAPSVLPSREKIRRRIEAAGMDESACEGLWLDEAFRAVVKAVRAIGAQENTCIIFTTDHPTAGKGSCHLGRIPLIVHWPGRIEGGEVRGQLLSETDLAPTILDIAGCTPPADMLLDGQSFASVFSDPDAQIRETVLMENVNSRAIISGKYKYIANRLPGREPDEEELCGLVGWLACPINGRRTMWWNLDRLFPAYFDADELYDLEADPLEQHNLISDPKLRGTAAALREKLALALSRLPHPFGEFSGAERQAD